MLLPLAAAMVIIGAHVTWTQGMMASYPIFMLAVALLLWFKYRKTQRTDNPPKAEPMKKKKQHR